MAPLGWLAVAMVALPSAASVYAVPAAICRLMNRGRRRFEATAAAPGPTAVVLLSGRTLISRHAGRTTAALAPECLARVREAARVYDLIAPVWVISAGGLPRPERGVPTSAELMRDELVRLGVPADRILTEVESRTTRDAAVRVARLLPGLGAPHVVIVTSEVHIPRALAAFRAQGVSGVAAGAADPGASRPWPAWVLPTAQGVRFSDEVLHELLGLAAYRALGWHA
jgi:uncharacterized SAM-binding protein YcdF (DUF218 family)